MYFYTGTTNLVSVTRDLAGDPASAASPLFSDQRVKDAINDQYIDLREAARQQGGGSGQKRSYADTVANQIFYELPSDFHRMVLMEVEYNGRDLSSDSNASSTFLREIGADTGIEIVEGGDITKSNAYFIHDQHVGLTNPVLTGGTNSMRISYECGTVELSAVDDVPDIPANFHRLIAYKAAVILRVTMDLPVDDLAALAARMEARFLRAMQDQGWSNESQFAVAGLGGKRNQTNFGRAVKIG